MNDKAIEIILDILDFLQALYQTIQKVAKTSAFG
jgi:hypothetical protein